MRRDVLPGIETSLDRPVCWRFNSRSELRSSLLCATEKSLKRNWGEGRTAPLPITRNGFRTRRKLVVLEGELGAKPERRRWLHEQSRAKERVLYVRHTSDTTVDLEGLIQ